MQGGIYNNNDYEFWQQKGFVNYPHSKIWYITLNIMSHDNLEC